MLRIGRALAVPSVLASSLVAFVLVGCSSGTNPSTTPSDQPVISETTPPPVNTEPTTVTSMGVLKSQTSASANVADHELTLQDCNVLGEQYKHLTINDQEKKQLDPNLRPDQMEKGKQSIEDAAAKLGARWTSSCQDSLVGKFSPEESLKCAMSAKTVSAFDACLNAPAPPPAGK